MSLSANAREDNRDLLSTLEEMRGDAFRSLLNLTLVSTVIWYLWERLRTPTANAPDKGLFIAPILLLEGLTYLLIPKHRRWAVFVYLVGAIASISAAIWLFKAPQATFLYSVTALAAVVIASPKVGLVTATVGSGAAYALMASQSGEVGPLSQVLVVALSAFTIVLVSWILFSNFSLAVRWSLSSYEKAQQSLQKVQERRAEVIHLNQELSRARERLEHTNMALVRAWRAAEEAERRQKQMTAFISHELRTPLNLIIGFSEMLVTSPEAYALDALPPKARRDLNAIYRSAGQLAALVDDVLDMASADQGELALMREPSDLWQVIVEAVAMVRDYVEAKNLSLWLNREKELPPLLMDRLRIRQVLLNLLINAARFTTAGSITVSADAEPGLVRVKVTDTGKGVSPEEMPHIFQEFHTAQSADSWWGKGTGLGLPFSRRLVRLHGGEMGVESEPGKGATFWFTLPLEAAPADESPQALAPSLMPVRSQAAEPKLIVLDEDEGTAHRLQRWLGGYHLVSAQTWAEAKSEAEALWPKALLVAQDTALPDEDVPLPVIRCPLPTTSQWARQLGVAAYLAKPIGSARLLRTLERVAPGCSSVLVVDDDERFVQLVARILETSQRPYRVQMAYNGEEALQRLREGPPDILLLDLALPKMDGRELLRQKAQDQLIASVPVVVISAPPVEDETAPLGNTLVLKQAEGWRFSQVTRLLNALLAALPPDGLRPGPSAGAPLAKPLE